MVVCSNQNKLGSLQYENTQIAKIDPKVLRDNRIIMMRNNDPRADLFRVLRTNVLKQLRDNNWNSFAITSATPGVGKTFVSINLAIAIAMEGNQKVLLVDADLRRPGITKYLGLNIKYGLNDLLAGTAHLQEILVNPGIDNLVLLPTKASGVNYSELLSSPQMASLIKKVKSYYDTEVIIFDVPPLFVADDTLLLLSHIDAALYVVEDGKNSEDELRQSMAILEETNLLGMVINKSRGKLPTYHYGYLSSNYN